MPNKKNDLSLRQILELLRDNGITVSEAEAQLHEKSVLDIGIANLDLDREKRHGLGEVVFGGGKTFKQLYEIYTNLKQHQDNILITKVSGQTGVKMQKAFPELQYFKEPGILQRISKEREKTGLVYVITAGTSDIPTAEEARICSEFFGNNTEKIYDIGVFGIHRVLKHYAELRKARVLIVIAGMEGALPSVIGGLVKAPVIGVPTDVGYGANFKGVSALLGMLNSCAPNVSVVNINNGFGAAYIAALINGAAS